MLKRIKEGKLYYYDHNNHSQVALGPNPLMSGNCSKIWGNCVGLFGDCSGLKGNCDYIGGDATGIEGDLDEVDRIKDPGAGLRLIDIRDCLASTPARKD